MRSHLHDIQLFKSRVFLRADLNVPLQGDRILSDFRLEALRPTLDLLVKKGAKTCIATHLGRPKGFDASLSTKLLLPWFIQKGYSVTCVSTLQEAHSLKVAMQPGTFLLLENLRFSKEEKDQFLLTTKAYAQSLKDLADYYVNDAWALMHKNDTSLTQVPLLFDQDKKTIGLLVQHELKGLKPLLNPPRPFVLILGGGKISQKLPLIEQALEVADSIIILPALAFTFLKAQGINVGKSLVDDALLEKASTIIIKAKQRGKELHLPVDYTYGLEDNSSLETGTSIPSDRRGIAVGPESLKHFENIIVQARSILLNGTMGFFDHPNTLKPQKKLLQSIAQLDAYRVIGGGDSVAAVNLFNLGKDISFLSTGGGATLKYILFRTIEGLSYLE